MSVQEDMGCFSVCGHSHQAAICPICFNTAGEYK